jgi:hypothetical protein
MKHDNCEGCSTKREAPICFLCIRNPRHADHYARKTRFDIVPNLRLQKRKVRIDKRTVTTGKGANEKLS